MSEKSGNFVSPEKWEPYSICVSSIFITVKIKDKSALDFVLCE